jgi:hypothetical protein
MGSECVDVTTRPQNEVPLAADSFTLSGTVGAGAAALAGTRSLGTAGNARLVAAPSVAERKSGETSAEDSCPRLSSHIETPMTTHSSASAHFTICL